MDDQRKRTLEALERRFAQSEAELHKKQHKSKKRQIEDKGKTSSNIESLSTDTAVKKPCSSAFSRKGNISFRGHNTAQDVKVNEPAYLELSYPVHENLLPTGVKNSDRKTAVDHILHQLFQHGDTSQKYMQGSKSMKIDNFILLDNFVPKSSSSRTHIRALKSHSKRSKKHMSLKQLKKCGSFDLSHEYHNFETFKPLHDKWKSNIQQLLKIVGENQLAQCLLNENLHGALVLVVQCKIVSYSGMSGILVHETKETFGIITQDNKFRGFPQAMCICLIVKEEDEGVILFYKNSSRRSIITESEVKTIVHFLQFVLQGLGTKGRFLPSGTGT